MAYATPRITAVRAEMRLLRFLALGVVLAVLGCILALKYAIHNEKQLVQVVLARINQGTGLEIVPSAIRISLGHHFVVVLEHPRVLVGQREIMRLDAIRAIVAYHLLIWNNGLPLYSLVLDHPEVRIPADVERTGSNGIPHLDAQAIATLKWGLDGLANVTTRLEVNGAALTSADNVRLVDHLDTMAYRQHRRPGNWPWLLNFQANWQRAALAGAHLAGNVWLGGENNADTLAAGRIWFGQLGLKNFTLDGVNLAGQTHGSLHFALSSLGDLNGNAEIGVHQLALSGEPLKTPMALGDYLLHTAFRAASAEAYLRNFTIRHAGQQILEGTVTVAHPYDSTRTLSMRFDKVTLSLQQAAQLLHSMRRVPAPTAAVADRVVSGQITLIQASIDPNVPLRDWTAATIRDNLAVQAVLSEGGFVLPDDLKLPRVSRAEAAITYSGAKLVLAQGSAQIGKSSVQAVNVQADFADAPRHLRYSGRLNGNIDISELYPALAAKLSGTEPGKALSKVEDINGEVPLEADVVGDMRGMVWRTPKRYWARADLSGVEASVKGAPAPIAIKSGRAIFRPEAVDLDRVEAIFRGPFAGDAIMSGRLDTRPKFPTPHELSVDFHSITAARWMPLFVHRDELSAKGTIQGRILINADAAHGDKPLVTGRFTMGPGEIQLGFLRSPIETQITTLTLNGKGMEVTLPSSKIEGEPVQMTFSVPDLDHPALRIDASAEKLDFEVMRFIRLPWSRATPPHFFAVPVSGHITSRSANFDKLPMENVASDFSHDNVDWHVTNFTARAFGGRIDMDIDGRARDNWIHIKGKIAGMDAKPLTALMDSSKQPPLTGELFARADLWANTDVDFYDTLAGAFTFEVRDGTLRRFVLLTRVLSLIDLKSWITARFPNPLITGVPFDALAGEFKGKQGDFYTDDLKLMGPLMSITARGELKLGAGTMDMRIGLVPFTTVNWIISKIPLMGKDIANSSNGLLAAYFQVRGPVNNPTIIPKPITSVANFVVKTLSLPINIIAPDRVHP
jgi:hypothetical protein